MINIIYNKDTAQKIHDQFTVFFICIYKSIGSTHNSRFTQHIPLIQSTSSADIRQRKKCSTAKAVFLQKTNHTFSCLFIICDDILNTSAQCSFNRNLIVFLHMNDISHNTFNTGFTVFLFHYTTDTVSISIITFCNVFKRFQAGSLTMVCCLTDFHLRILFFQFIL